MSLEAGRGAAHCTGSHLVTGSRCTRSSSSSPPYLAGVGFLDARHRRSPLRRNHAGHEESPIATPPSNNEPRINDRIRAREVRLVGPDGAQIGIKPLPEALAFARELDLDLVEVAAMANPPVCRIMDFGKFKYEAAQQAKESRRKSTAVAIKEMKYRPKIGSGDFDTKTTPGREVPRPGSQGQGHDHVPGPRGAASRARPRILERVAEAVPTSGGSRSCRSSTAATW